MFLGSLVQDHIKCCEILLGQLYAWIREKLISRVTAKGKVIFPGCFTLKLFV